MSIVSDEPQKAKIRWCHFLSSSPAYVRAAGGSRGEMVRFLVFFNSVLSWFDSKKLDITHQSLLSTFATTGESITTKTKKKPEFNNVIVFARSSKPPFFAFHLCQIQFVERRHWQKRNKNCDFFSPVFVWLLNCAMRKTALECKWHTKAC